MTIIGIDFETANSARNSACQIGLVAFEKGRVVDQYVSLIKPPGEFGAMQMSIHGITPSRVAKAPTLASIWPNVSAFLARGKRIVAHNAAFDRGVLVASLAHHGIAAPPADIECTVALARKRLPHLTDHKLPTVCAALGIPFTDHHDALADARAAAAVAWALTQKVKA
jgi:DNA polymerase-3 subunit epsilon